MVPLVSGSNTFTRHDPRRLRPVDHRQISPVVYYSADVGDRLAGYDRDAPTDLAIRIDRGSPASGRRCGRLGVQTVSSCSHGSLVGSACRVRRSSDRRSAMGRVSTALAASPCAIRPSAQAEAARTTGSSVDRRVEPRAASTASALRRCRGRAPRCAAARRAWPATSAVPLSLAPPGRRDRRPASRSGRGRPISGRGSSSAIRPDGALRFQGQTSWQMSQPKTQPSSWSASSSAIGPAMLDRPVADAPARVELVGAGEGVGRAGVEAARAGAAVVGRVGRVVGQLEVDRAGRPGT